MLCATGQRQHCRGARAGGWHGWKQSDGVAAGSVADQGDHVIGIFLMLLQAVSELFKDILRHSRRGDLMSYEMIAILMFSSMMLMLLTGQRVFGAIGGFAAVVAALRCGAPAVTTFRSRRR
jgi:hypothetical protein